MTYTIGNYLADRLEQMGLRHYFIVPGDFNLTLLDQLLVNRNMQQINCCNELNASYAAEGYARVQGAGALVVTYNVGAFSALNGIAGAYAERLPVVLISGGYNTNDPAEGHIVHHTIEITDLSYQYDIMKKVTCDAARILHAKDAPHLIDRVLQTVMRERKPGYIEIPCNLASAECSRPTPQATLGQLPVSDPRTLSSAVEATAGLLANAERPILLAGPHLRSYDATEAFRQLAEALGCAVAVQPNAKGLFPETHPQFIGIYWGEVGTPGVQEAIDRADLVIAAGPVYSDYITVGWTAQPPPGKTVNVESDHVGLPTTHYDGAVMAEYLNALAKLVRGNDASLVQFRRSRAEPRTLQQGEPSASLTRVEMVRQIQELVDPQTTVLVESGDAWFDSMYLSLPEGASYEVEMQYGSIGWSVPASFGYALGVDPERKLISMIGDGSFQLTAQEVASMIRYERNNIMFLINNHGYVSESEIHEGPYNYIKNWDYAGLMASFNAGEGKGLGLKARTGVELANAIDVAREHKGGPILIECQLAHDDYAPQLKQWGQKVAAANSRPPAKE
jgi:pyruvate decarboxylase